MILQFIILINLMSMMSFKATYASGLQCPVSNKIQYKSYGFLPTCPLKNAVTAQDNDTCWMAAASTSPASAVVMTKLSTESSCRVTAALCPRYQLTSDTTSVFIPVGITVLEHVVFSIKTGCGIKVWDLFTGASPANSDYVVQPVHPDAATLPKAFRSSLLDKMQHLISRLIYKHFIVQLYKDTTVVQRLVFDVGVSSVDVTNWFDKNRLIESSPVTNLKSMGANVFSIEGHVTPGLPRRFFISLTYNGCPGDTALMLVLDAGNDDCSFYKYSHPVPRIVYSRDVTKPMATTVMDADYMAILVV